jgi:hypothetical protein
MRPMAMILLGRGVGSLRRQRAFRAPHAFQAIKLSRIWAEQVDYQITRINQHPIARGLNGIALDMQPSLAERFIQMRRHGLQLALNLTGRDDQPIRVIGAAGHVQDHDVFGLVVFQALARGFYKYFQPVRCKFFAASAAGGAGRRDLGGRFCLGLGLAGLGGRFWRWLSRSCFDGGALRRWRGSRCFRRSLAGLGGRLWRWLRHGGFGGGALRRWRGSRCFRRSLAGLGGRLWRWLSCGSFGGSTLRRRLGGSGFPRSLRLGRGCGFRLGARLCLGRGFGFWLGGDGPLWAFFSRGGLAGYGRLLSFEPSVTGAALPP